jgi:hypothetical protein
MTADSPDKATVCPLCAGDNNCALTTPCQTIADCWCLTASISPEALERIPQDQINTTCICQACATATDSNASEA